jgi:flagellar basal-body rod protein FlgC
MDLSSAMTIAAAGMRAQSARLQVTAENLANAESTGLVPGDEPFRRKTVSFAPRRDRASGIELVDVRRIGLDQKPFEPALPAWPPRGRRGGLRQVPEREPPDRAGRHARGAA